MSAWQTEHNAPTLRQLPAVSRILQDEQVQQAIQQHGRELVVDCVRQVLDGLREQIKQGDAVKVDLPLVVNEVMHTVQRWRACAGDLCR
ncbi:MAG: hypothetical protein ACUVSE_02010 [Armatimonadota bacterium]